MSTTLAPSQKVTHRDSKGLKFTSVVEAAYDKANLSDDEAQRVNDTPGLADVIASFIEENRRPNQFASEEVRSSYCYPVGYRLEGITTQTNILRELFPGIGFADEKIAQQPLPPDAEGWFAVPKWQTMAATYNEAVEKVLAIIASRRKFYNWREGKLGADRLRQHVRTVEMFQVLCDQQKDHDILVIPAQFGLRHRGRSVRRAREIFTSNEFGLGAFEVGIMILTHPERLVRWEQLHIDCPGDEFAPDADGQFSYAPLFRFDDDEVRFDTYPVSSADEHYGSASGFLPQ